MNLPTESLPPREAYKLLTAAVVPRPIAWVSTMSPDGRPNLAPFSFFQAVCDQPPTLVVSVGRRADGEWKDTARNAVATGDLVVNVVSLELAEAMNQTSASYPYGISEFEQAGLEPVPSSLVRPPRVGAAAIALECRLAQTMDLGGSPARYRLLFAEVVGFFIRDDLLQDGRVDLAALQPLGRLAGNLFARPGEIFELVRPA